MLHFPKWKIGFVLLVCVTAIFLTIPNFLSKEARESKFIPSSTINLGLDLRGGSYLLLKVDFKTYLNEQLQILVDETRKKLRKKRIGYKNLSINGASVKFLLRDSTRQDEVEELFAPSFTEMEFNIDNGVNASIRYRDATLKRMKRSVLEQSIEIVRRRVDETGTREPSIQRQGEDRILLQVPGLKDPEHLKKLLGQTAKMTFHLMDDTDPFPSGMRKAPAGMKLLHGDGKNKGYYLIRKRIVLSGEDLVDSRASFDSNNRPAVSFRFNTRGGRKFAKITKDNVEKPFAIVLDNKVISAPVIQSPILGGSGIITGNFTVSSANDLALLLRAGSLPAPLKIMEERTVGPSLGHDSIEAGKKASIVAVIFVVILMIVFYGLFGVFSNIALTMNMILVFAFLSLFQATLTLPGIAGMVLTVGMAVDANVLIFERIRDEIALGRTPFAAVDYGFKQAFKTIIDSNVTTLIATLLLFIYGSGPVKGFAVTLSIGILCSMFSAILLTRMMIVLWLKKNKPSVLPI